MRPLLIVFSLMIVAEIFYALIFSIKKKFVNQDSPLWFLTLSLNWILSVVLVICVLKADKKITAFEEQMSQIEGFQADRDFLRIRKRQVKTFASWFIWLTTFDLVALIVFLILFDDGDTRSTTCFCACS